VERSSGPGADQQDTFPVLSWGAVALVVALGTPLVLGVGYLVFDEIGAGLLAPLGGMIAGLIGVQVYARRSARRGEEPRR
jgi:hypothetical protein